MLKKLYIGFLLAIASCLPAVNAWSAAITTNDLPYFCDFEDDTENANWTLNPAVNTITTENRWVMYMGGADPLEKRLTVNCEKVVKMMYEVGFNDDNFWYYKDQTKIHHESAWSAVIEDCIKFILR